MKKVALKILILCMAICSALCVFTACGGGTNIELSFVVDNKVVQTVKTTGSELIEIPDDPEKVGYTFDGWYWDKDTWDTPFTANSLLNAPISKNMSIYAKFKAIEYTATFMADESEVGTATFTIEDVSIANIPEVPEKTGYTGVWEEYTIITDNITVNAIYTINKYTVIWKNYDGTVLETDENVEHGTVPEYNGDIPEKTADAQYTYTFDKFEPVISELTGDITYTATYSNTVNKYTVVWKNFDGTVLKTDKDVPYGQRPEYNGTTPENIGNQQYSYVFENIWSPAVESVTGNAEYIAQFTQETNQYTITFYDEDKTTVLGTATVDYGTNATYPKTTPVKTQGNRYTYAFDKWLKADNTADDLTNVIDNRNVYANYTATPKVYNVYFIENGGNDISDATYTYSVGLSVLPDESDISKTGYTFEGWKDAQGNAITAVSTEMYGDITLYAQWQAVTYYASFYADETLVDTKPFTVEDTEIANIPSVPEKTCYTGEWEGYAILAENITINAFYTPIECTITYVNVKTATNNNQTKYNIESEKITLIDLDNVDGYTFNCWLDEDGNKITEIPAGSFGNREITAKWTKVIILLNDDSAGQVLMSSETHFAGDEITISATVNRGYDWLGWYNETALITNDLTYTFIIPEDEIILIPKWTIKEEMMGFDFISSVDTCLITGVKDKTVTEIIIPDYVTSIGRGVFSGCSSIQKMTIPFVGDSVKTASDTYHYPFGYIFGTSFYTGGTATTQYTSSSTNRSYYIPTTLKSVTVTGSNILYGAFYNCSGLTSITIPDSVTSIGVRAFYNCSGLTSITIPSGVTSIGKSAFYNCSRLTSITIPDSVTSIGAGAFSGCSSLTSMTIPFVGATLNGTSNTYFGYIFGSNNYSDNSTCVPSSLKTIVITGGNSIGSDAFYNCSSLTSITIPDSVTSIGEGAFSGCSGLQYNEYDNGYYLGNGDNHYLVLRKAKGTSITSCAIHDGTKIIYSSAFSNCSNLTNVTIPDSVTSIGNYAFYNCSSLTSITIPDSVTSIGYHAFYNCSGLTSITLSDSVTSIGSDAFYFCRSLTSITIPDSVTSIGVRAFYGCSSLTSITIGNGVMSIGERAFDGCSKLTSINVSGSNTMYKSIDDNLYSKDGKTFIQYAREKTATSFVIPDSVTSIGSYAFSGCSKLTSISIPDSVTSIGESAFGGCSGLTSITIPSSVTSIGKSAFSGCSKLTSITIPSSVTSIGKSAFSGCSKLTSISIPDSVTSIGEYAFYDCSGLTSITIGNSVTSIGEKAFYGCGVSQYSEYDNGYYLGNGDNPYLVLVQAKNTSITSCVIHNSTKIICNSAFSKCNGLTSVTIPNSVTSIGRYAFSGCSKLTSISIPDSVTNIGDSAFSGCSGLTSITIPFGATKDGRGNNIFGSLFVPPSLNTVIITRSNSIGDYAFYDYSGLTSVIIPDSVTSIGERAFYNCSALTSITIPNSVTSIGSGAFYNCSSLTSVIFEENSQLTNIGSDAFAACSGLTSVTIPNGVTSIGKSAFSGCSKLTSITIPDSVTSIDDYAFSSCSSLTKVNYTGTIDGWCEIKFRCGEANPLYYVHNLYINNELVTVANITTSTKINDYAFSGCSSLTSIAIGNSVTSIGNYAFYNCSSLTSITIPDSVTSIGYRAFSGCSSLKSITIPDSVTSIGERAFYGCSGLTSIAIGNSVTSIGSYAFYKCSSLKSITIPDSVTSIGSDAFEDCSSLTSITIGNGVMSIGGESFRGCSGLTSITIPDSVTSIGESAFYFCRSLTSITIPDSVTSIEGSAFFSCDRLQYNEYDNGYYLGNDNNLYLVLVRAKNTSITSCIIHESTKFVCSSAFNGCGNLTSITIPDSVTNIGGAFYNCSGLTSITIPDSVTSIGNDTFYNCSGLTSITIPDSVTSIGSYAFYKCSSLTSIMFNGTKAQWIAMDDSNWRWKEDISSSCVVYCSDGYLGV